MEMALLFRFVSFQKIAMSSIYAILFPVHIRNWSLQPFSKNYGRAAHTTLLCALIFCISAGTYSFKVDSVRQIFEKLFIAILFTLSVYARNLLRGGRRRNISSYFV